uniref:WD repeat-containing protein 75-like n=1 Tax=Hirondellea gigas TaxID=1518452 RepID=A0A2P2I9S9_9CRUS
MEVIDEVCFGRIRKEGGRMNYSKPLLLDNGKKVAVACGFDIRILNVSDSRHVSTLSMHKAKVIGMAMDCSSSSGDNVLSCDEGGELFVWKLLPVGVECVPLGKYPIPPTAAVEHIAYVGERGELACIVMMNKGVGPRQLLLQRGRTNKKNDKYTVLATDVLPGFNTCSFSATQSFCAVLTASHCSLACSIVPIYASHSSKATRKNRRILCGERQPTCVAVHPTDETLAVGDHFGGVEVYFNVFQQKHSGSRRLHWHSLPVCDLLFAHSGTELYSSGHEGALVQWHQAEGNKADKDILPRLGLPVTHMAISKDSSTMVVTHSDNSFSLINLFELKLESVLLGQGITLPEQDSSGGVGGKNSTASSRVVPLLAYDPRTAAVVTKAKPGYFHFYHTPTQQQLFLVDVVQENYIGAASGYRDVLHMSLDRSGCYMATVDSMFGVDNKQQQLKFWNFSRTSNRWMLSTSIVFPHSGDVGGCLLQPVVQPSSDASSSSVVMTDSDHDAPLPFCLTWSTDCEIKIWAANLINGSLVWSTLDSRVYKKGLSATAASWSPCGSVVAVAYGPVLTLWTPAPLKWKCQFSKQQHFPDDIFAVRFSPWCGGSTVVVCSSSAVMAWNITTRRILYIAPLDAVALDADVHTGLMAVATKQGEIVVFRGEEGSPLCRLDADVSSPRTLLFCPPLTPSIRHLTTRLLYYTQDMELLSVPISLCGPEVSFEEQDPENEAEELKPQQRSKLSCIVAESTATVAPADTIFAFKHADKMAYIRPDVFTKEFEDTNYQRPSLSKLLDCFATSLDEASK